jgi:streptogramin lyase
MGLPSSSRSSVPGVTRSYLVALALTIAALGWPRNAAAQITEFPIPTPNSLPQGMTVGPDGALWFTENAAAANKIGRITSAGAITEHTIPTSNSGPAYITSGPDGALWFTENGGNKIGRITTAGTITNEYPIPQGGAQPIGITTGPDGNRGSLNPTRARSTKSGA